MSAAEDEEKMEANTMMCCASCGKTEVDDVKLKICTACKLVKYCSVECQKNHRSQHKRACKKRAREIREGELFRQPDESFLGECPICCLPIPLDQSKFSINTCCSKRICKGCEYATMLRDEEEGLEERCPYCREPVPDTQEECDQNTIKRVKANDPLALCETAKKCDDEGDYEGSIQYYAKAAALGYAEAHFNLSCMYDEGRGVEKDNKKRVYHLEEAAIGGHHLARYNLGCVENASRRIDRAAKHFIIAANLGYDHALEHVKEGFQMGIVSKGDFEMALRGHQAAVDETKSQQRDAAAEYYKRQNQKQPI